MALDPITAVMNVAGSVIDRIWPDPAQAAQAKLQLMQLQQSGELAQLTGQMDIDKAEAESTDKLQHWRGGLGWVCTSAYFYHFVVHPLAGGILTIVGHPVVLPTLDVSELTTLTMGMLGLGGLHVAERIKGVS